MDYLHKLLKTQKCIKNIKIVLILSTQLCMHLFFIDSHNFSNQV